MYQFINASSLVELEDKILDITLDSFNKGTKTVGIDISKETFNLFDASTIISSVSNKLINENIGVDFGFKTKKETIRMKFILEQLPVTV